MLDVRNSRELQATILALRGAQRQIRTGINKEARSRIRPLWQQALNARARDEMTRRIIVAGYQTTALAGTLDIELTRGSAASSGGTAVTPIAANPADPAADTTVKTLPTITAATVVVNWPFAATPTTAATAQGSTVLYDWQEAGDTKPLTLRAGNLDTLVLNAISTAAQAWTLTVAVTFTEE